MKDPLLAALYVFILGFEGAYLFSEIQPVSVWWYLPLEHRWVWLSSPGNTLGMGWYGKVLFCWGIGSVCGILIYGGMKVLHRPLSPNWLGLLDVSVMGLTLFSLYFLFQTMMARTF